MARADDRVTLMGAHASSLVAEVEKGAGMPVENATCTSRHLKVSPRPSSRGWLRVPACGVCCDGGATPQPTPSTLFSTGTHRRFSARCMRMDDIAERSELVGGVASGAWSTTRKFCDYYGIEYGALAEKDEIPHGQD